MKNNFSISIGESYEQSDVLLILGLMDERIHRLENAVADKKSGKGFDFLLLQPLVLPLLRKVRSCGFDTSQVDKEITNRKTIISNLIYELSSIVR